MINRIAALGTAVNSSLGKIPTRARWSFVDQALVSGVNALTGIIIVRSLGLHAFGEYAIVLLCLQFAAVPHMAGIVGPMMSLFDRRGDVSSSDYLIAVLVHQAVYAAIVVVALMVAYSAFEFGVGFTLVLTAAIVTQAQDLARRYFYVTERPVRAFVCDALSYGGRLVVIAMLAYSGELTVALVWTVVVVAAGAATLFLIPDLVRWSGSFGAVRSVTTAHKRIAFWMVGASLAAYFGDSGYVLLVVGAVLGPSQLGGALAVETMVLAVNLLLQSLENFLPSSVTKSLVHGGAASLVRYVVRISAVGAAAITIVVAALMVFADPLFTLVYGRTFPDQLALLAIFGVFYVFGYISAVIMASLRALETMRGAFVTQAVIGAASIALSWYAASAWGVLGALLTMLVLRIASTGQLALLLRRKLRTL